MELRQDPAAEQGLSSRHSTPGGDSRQSAGATGRAAILIDKVDLSDRSWLRVGGSGVSETDLRIELVAANPEMEHSRAIGNLTLEIEVDADLGDQFKVGKVVDRRCGEARVISLASSEEAH